MPSYSSNPLNRILQAPVLVLSGVGSRLMMTIRDDMSPTYTVDASIAQGDVIRYDPVSSAYVRSQADTPKNAEVVGIVETIKTEGSVTFYEIVSQGSIKYPSSRLTAITGSGTQTDADSGGYDVLFLDSSVIGGLTATAPSRGIAKVVAQVAPHGDFNAIVVNYIGYEVGTEAVARDMGLIGDIRIVPSDTELGDGFLDASVSQLLPISDYQDLYGVIGDQELYWEQIVLTENTVVTVAWSSLVNQVAFQLVNGIRVNSAIIKQVDQTTSSIWVQKTQDQVLYNSELPLYITTPNTANILGYISSNAKSHFTLPAVQSPQLTIGNATVKPVIIAQPTARTYIPSDLEIKNMTVSESLTVDGRDVLGELDQLKTLVDQINQFYNL